MSYNFAVEFAMSLDYEHFQYQHATKVFVHAASTDVAVAVDVVVDVAVDVAVTVAVAVVVYVVVVTFCCYCK